jgi:DNA-binding response OmpR family regulator
MKDNRILILDDNEAILDMVTEALLYEGFDVHSITFGHQFFEAVKEFEPELVLLDYRLADTNGGDLCNQLKDHPGFRHIPVIIFSAYFHRNDSDRPGGCDGILYKPFDLVELLTMIRQHMEPVKMA